jgi:hypothetical protein
LEKMFFLLLRRCGKKTINETLYRFVGFCNTIRKRHTKKKKCK